MEFRQAELKDLSDVARLVTITFANEIGEKMPYLKEKGNPNKFLGAWNHWAVNSKYHNIFVCYDGEELAGAAGGYLQTQAYSDEPIYGIEDFWYVKSKYRTKKVGIKLYKMLEEWFIGMGADKMHMMSYPFAPNVDSFYKHEGFMPVEQTWVKNLMESKPILEGEYSEEKAEKSSDQEEELTPLAEVLLEDQLALNGEKSED
jgi:GNAT superfamily N-acetyltransferase